MRSRHYGRGVLSLVLALGAVLAAREANAQARTRIIPEDTVVRVELEQRVSSRTARVGDPVLARLDEQDTSGFPLGTRFEGTITEVQRAAADRPGILDMRFRTAVLPDGRRVRIDADLASLAAEDVRRTSEGRLESRRRGGGSDFDWKWVGYGAAAGALLATILDESFLRGALLGGLGGAIYAYIRRDRDRGEFRDVTLAEGTEFGLRLNDRVAFADRPDYRYAAFDDALADRVAGAREEWRAGDSVVRVNDRQVDFGDARPLRIGNVLYVPLAPIAESAGMRLRHRFGEESFVLETRRGPTRYYVGERPARSGVENPPLLIDGQIYVSTDWLSREAEMRVRWDRTTRRLELQTLR